jgi:hypothetical protein
MELHCASPVPRDRQALCAEAVRAQAEVYRLKPLVDSELSKAEPDWDKVLPYVDAVIGALGKRALTPYTP